MHRKVVQGWLVDEQGIERKIKRPPLRGNGLRAPDTMRDHSRLLYHNERMMAMADKPDCYKCEYRGSVPGDAHSCCKYPGNDTGILSFFADKNVENAKTLNIKAYRHGVMSGWFLWPVNFDPAWLINCDGFKAKEG